MKLGLNCSKEKTLMMSRISDSELEYLQLRLECEQEITRDAIEILRTENETRTKIYRATGTLLLAVNKASDND
jgi:hypothetical protein